MQIVCATDGNYMRHCVAMLHSLWVHNQDPDLDVYLIYDNVDSEQLGIVASYLHNLLPRFSLLQASSEPLDGFPFNGHATIATYFRLLLPEILPMSVKRVIFIDADTTVTNSLAPLWQLSLQGKALGAIAEHHLSCQDHGYEYGRYFNAGIMLVDLEKWRQSNLLERGRRFARSNPDRLRHWDQDVLNHVFEDDWLEISNRWNACPHLFGLTREYDSIGYQFTADEKEAVSNPAIIHFAGPGPIKPWNAQCKHPLKEHYLQARAATPWADTPLDDIRPAAWVIAYKQAVFRMKCLIRRRLIGQASGTQATP
jgi:lipopolysaccharide biosynthesis glycosyltransferase